MPKKRKSSSVKVGKRYYLAHPGEVAWVEVLELGTGDRILTRVPKNPVVILEVMGSAKGDTGVISADSLHTSLKAAAIEAVELGEEAMHEDLR